jgi:hypothetical protein
MFGVGSFKIQFNGAAGWTDLDRSHTPNTHVEYRSPLMSNASTTMVLTLLAVCAAAPTASFARTAGQAGMGNVPISGIAPGPANAGGLNNAGVDPSGIGNASRVAPLPTPRITPPRVPRFK